MKKKFGAGKITLLVVAVLAAAAASWIVPNSHDLAAFIPVPAGAYAKFMASALFIEGRTEEQARNWSALSLPVGKVTIDSEHKNVTVEAYFQKATARWVDEKHGVVLE